MPKIWRLCDYNSCNIIGWRRYAALAAIDAANAQAVFGPDRHTHHVSADGVAGHGP